ncbi:MAG: dephospho-CoA kinase [Ruminococcaceae bacterium]|nr:dephospho-CoA kinase [Oscillospiraceae bacterium]
MFIIGVTGGSGSGKSTVANLFAEHGGVAIDADRVYHEMLDTCAPMQRDILARFPTVQGEDGRVDRSRLAHIVFIDDNALGALNQITQPYIIEELERMFEECYRQNQPFVVLDVIRLFESSLSRLCDVTIGVIADEETRVKRITERDKISESRARDRIRAQQSNDYYKSKCDHIIENNGVDDVASATETLYREIMEERAE